MLQPIVLFEDNHLLVVNKPAGLATAGVKDAASVYEWAGAYIKRKYSKPGNVFVGIVSRLDTMTSGVLVLARTSKAASRLSEQIRAHQFQKSYLAVVEGHLVSRAGEIWVDQMYKDDAAHRMRTLGNLGALGDVRASGSRAKNRAVNQGSEAVRVQEARLQIDSVRQLRVGTADASIISVQLLTGRKHQIRVQCAARGHVVWGDRKYGARTSDLRGNAGHDRGIALHAHSLALTHPTLKQRMTFTAAVPETWHRFGPVEAVSEKDSGQSS